MVALGQITADSLSSSASAPYHFRKASSCLCVTSAIFFGCGYCIGDKLLHSKSGEFRFAEVHLDSAGATAMGLVVRVNEL